MNTIWFIVLTFNHQTQKTAEQIAETKINESEKQRCGPSDKQYKNMHTVKPHICVYILGSRIYNDNICSSKKGSLSIFLKELRYPLGR